MDTEHFLLLLILMVILAFVMRSWWRSLDDRRRAQHYATELLAADIYEAHRRTQRPLDLVGGQYRFDIPAPTWDELPGEDRNRIREYVRLRLPGLLP